MRLDETALDATRVRLLELVDEMYSMERIADCAPMAREVFDTAYALGRAATRQPELTETAAWDALVEETASALVRVHHRVSGARYVTVLDRLTDPPRELSPDHWEDACRRASAVQFLATLYRGTVFAEYNDLVEEGIPETDPIRECGELSGPVASIPDGIPTSHWWWWLPDAPP